ncbi:MAG: TIM barrel protein [Saprospiraceae bacterium]|nr:TIM barrel protein [Saprospiraceae bacterium]
MTYLIRIVLIFMGAIVVGGAVGQSNAIEGINQRVVLAQWSFNKELFNGEMTTFDFVDEAKSMGFAGVEYVNQFFMDKKEDFTYLDSLKKHAQNQGIQNTLLMIDRAGNLGASDDMERNQAVEEHKKWVLAAKAMGCPTIRINAHGDGTADQMLEACIESIGALAAWSNLQGVGVLIENHGGFSSDGNWLVRLLNALAEYHVGCIADFDNWCIERENGELWGSTCTKSFNRYEGVSMLLSTAKSISVKAFDFDENGMPIKTNFEQMFDLINTSGYTGYLAVEFEGHTLPAKEGILKTKALLERLSAQ